MAMVFEPLNLPLEEDDHGVIRVTGNRVPIDFIIYDYCNGATVEEIALAYPTLRLADIHSVLSYYLLHQKDVDDYLRTQEHLSEQKHQEVLRRSPQADLRGRLRSRFRCSF